MGAIPVTIHELLTRWSARRQLDQRHKLTYTILPDALRAAIPGLRSQLTSLRARPDDHFDFPPLRELRRRLGAPARVGTGKLSFQVTHYLTSSLTHYLTYYLTHFTIHFCDDLARTPQAPSSQSDASG